MLADIVGIIRNHHGDAQFLAQAGQSVVHDRQLLNVFMALQLQKVTVAKQLPVLEYLLAGLLRSAVGE